MPGTRDHAPIIIEDFNGLWKRGDHEAVPLDHFAQADNIQFIHSGFETRDVIAPYRPDVEKIDGVSRIYEYITPHGQTLLVLKQGDPLAAPPVPATIWHVIPNVGTFGPIYSHIEMQDFGFVAYNGRAYITPFRLYPNPDTGISTELGVNGAKVQVFQEGYTTTRSIGGTRPVGTALVVTESVTAGNHDEGFHLIGVVYETDSGFLTEPGPSGAGGSAYGSATYSADTTKAIDVSNIPIGPAPDATHPKIVKRHIVSTKTIPEYNGNQDGYQFFFVPDGNINDNTTTTKTVSYFDADLVSDASHLIDSFTDVDAGVYLTLYHNRMVLVGQHDDPSVARISAPGEPESFNEIDGLIIAPLDGNPLTAAQEFRDILYLYKKTMTIAYSDNDDEPATWQQDIIDQAIGSPVHGIAQVLDSGGVNIDFLLVADYSGLMLFNGTYARPELSWKIDDFWTSLNRNAFRFIQLVNDSITKKIWITLMEPQRTTLLHADYSNGLNAKDIRWSKWIFDAKISSVALIDTTKLILGGLSDSAHSGVFYVLKGTRDKYYNGLEVKIPNPTIRTALIGD